MCACMFFVVALLVLLFPMLLSFFARYIFMFHIISMDDGMTQKWPILVHNHTCRCLFNRREYMRRCLVEHDEVTGGG